MATAAVGTLCKAPEVFFCPGTRLANMNRVIFEAL
jgi:hypothetical protein